ncbi:unnamed protein product [Ambrosiozyma monospora]|uniref:Unnamed protein product n=1 Tax=Ambrosiozyma monospora TaxID=43982 RepID=A0A9W6YVY7_AMBMO|nr:unnamed protein product [Ambrosiozyma monospora]
MSFEYAPYMIGVQFVSIYFQVVRDNNEVHTDLSLLSFIIICSIFSTIGGLSIKLSGSTKSFSMTFGVILCVGYGVLEFLQVQEKFSKRFCLLIVLGVGAGIMIQPAFVCVQVLAPKENHGLIICQFCKKLHLCLNLSSHTETLISNLAHVAKIRVRSMISLLGLIWLSLLIIQDC